MANQKITQLNSITWSSVDANNDVIPIVDVNDTSMAPSGTTKKISAGQLISSLVPQTRTLTINGTTYDLSANRSWTIAVGGGLTVGTTAIASGTVGRLLFQGSGDVVQQDSALFWDNTNKRLGVGATPSTSVRLDVRAQGALSTDVAFRVRNSADTNNLASITGDGVLNLANLADNTRIAINATTSGQYSIAMGSGNPSLGTVNIGFFNTANGTHGVIVGNNNQAVVSGSCGITIGVDNSHTIGVCVGRNNSGSASIIMGNNNAIGGSGASNGNVIAIGRGMTETSGNAKMPHTFMFGSYSTTGNKAGLTFRSNNINHLLLGYDIMDASYSSTNGTNWFGIKNGTAPDGAVDAFQQYSADIVAGNAAPHFRTENGDVIKLYRVGGWGLPTGTFTRTTFDTATVTTAELAERVAALIQDLRDNHGLLKA